MLNEADMSTLMMALYFHPQRDAKIGAGAQDIQVSQNQENKNINGLMFQNINDTCSTKMRLVI